MAVMRVNPNRMELMRLREQLSVARRGHKLLKDKRDELMRQFISTVKHNQELRAEVENLLKQYNQEMVLARAVMPEQVIETALFSGYDNLILQSRRKNLMSVQVPEFFVYDQRMMEDRDERRERARERDRSQTYIPYGFTGVSGELDHAILALRKALPVMIELATVEKTIQLLAGEIAKTRRRVNSLEHRMIPDLEDTIRSITMKMEENERANTTRLMKVKDLILEKEIRERRRRHEKMS
ncbi:MAG: V-type ATP synthase subunit D [Clostridiaceae bacterium]|jgi:V/A-type H+-transporting ATPase subunit D|nr:V-type ATP synthase subunit D [Bacillota bacterium]NLN51838.1 V-type ATP synthase subunit D [Clostridiaceae bacterium]